MYDFNDQSFLEFLYLFLQYIPCLVANSSLLKQKQKKKGKRKEEVLSCDVPATKIHSQANVHLLWQMHTIISARVFLIYAYLSSSLRGVNTIYFNDMLIFSMGYYSWNDENTSTFAQWNYSNLRLEKAPFFTAWNTT